MRKLNLPAGFVLSAVFSFLFEKLAGETERLFAGISHATRPSASAVPAPAPAVAAFDGSGREPSLHARRGC